MSYNKSMAVLLDVITSTLQSLQKHENWGQEKANNFFQILDMFLIF